jgi:hypothetical protein
LLAYVDVNILQDNIDTMRKNTETLIGTGREVGLEVNAVQTKYMLLSHHQNAGQNHDINIANISFKMCHSSDIWGRQ